MENNKYKNVGEYVEHLIQLKEDGEELTDNENSLIETYWITKTLDIG